MLTAKVAKQIKRNHGIGSILSEGSNAKLAKSDKKSDEYLSAIVYLAPANELRKALQNPVLRDQIGSDNAARLNGVNIPSTCPWATAGCEAACLYTAGRGRMSNVQVARARRTILYHADRVAFWAVLRQEIAAFVRKAERAGKLAAIRLDGTSDVLTAGAWAEGIMAEFPTVQWYGYSKSEALATRQDWVDNVDVTFSRAETTDNQAAALRVLRDGGKVAAVFNTLPSEWQGFEVVDGDADDLTFLRPEGTVQGLIPKGAAKVDTTGFVIG